MLIKLLNRNSVQRLFTLFLLSSLVVFSANAQSLFDTSAKNLFNTDDEFVSVDEAFVFSSSQADHRLTINFNIKEGYYLYRHQFTFTVENAAMAPVELPQGIDHEDEFFGVQQIYQQALSFDINILNADDPGSITVRYQGCAAKGLCYPPTTQKVSLQPVSPASSQQAVLSALSATSAAQVPVASERATSKQVTSEQNRLADMLKQDSLLLTLLAFFIGGLLLSFTPCVFPMYPILTGIIVGQQKILTTKKAFVLSLVYVQGMAVTYTLLGIVVALAGAKFQGVFQHPVVLVSLSVLFILLALSMFGLFNLALPASWQNKLNNLSNKQQGGSYTGVLLMGMISGLVASPCTTAPLTGALLYISQTGDVLLGASALYALSLGMGMPLLILGSSGGKLLPKAGSWMNMIKNTFGFLLLAVPVFLLERIIPAVYVDVLWAVLILATAAYFYVENQKSPSGFWYGVRALLIFLALFVGASNLYDVVFPSQLVFPSQPSSGEQQSTRNVGQKFLHVSSLTELKQAVSAANQQGKSVMVDLYADWCIACKEFEHYTFNTPQVQTALANTVLVQIDLTDTSAPDSVELMTHFNVLGLPSILFFDKQGVELSEQRVTGFMDADAFAAHVNAIL